ncbi:MAG: DUF86 domain-containing protein [Nitrospira sp.]|nr:DUF86 domain-containing protein [Nitrospira sp.]
MRNDRERIRDILEAIERIERYVPDGQPRFEQDELLQTWMVHHIQIIGEAARKLSDSLRNNHPEIPWPQIITMRNVLVHDYFGLDLQEVWMTVERDIPDLKPKIQAILQEVEDPS